jgi:hypothetical protein
MENDEVTKSQVLDSWRKGLAARRESLDRMAAQLAEEQKEYDAEAGSQDPDAALAEAYTLATDAMARVFALASERGRGLSTAEQVAAELNQEAKARTFAPNRGTTGARFSRRGGGLGG